MVQPFDMDETKVHDSEAMAFDDSPTLLTFLAGIKKKINEIIEDHMSFSNRLNGFFAWVDTKIDEYMLAHVQAEAEAKIQSLMDDGTIPTLITAQLWPQFVDQQHTSFEIFKAELEADNAAFADTLAASNQQLVTNLETTNQAFVNSVQTTMYNNLLAMIKVILGGTIPEGSGADTTPPAAPTNVSVSDSDTAVQLSWTNPTDADLAGVAVIRKSGSYPTDPSDGVQRYVGTGTTFIDTGLTDGETYYYSIFAFDGTPNFSVPAHALGQPLDSIPPNPVTGLTALGGYQKNILTWTNPALDFAGVTVVRKATDYPATATDGTVIYEGTANGFIDSSRTNGVQDYYSVFAHDAANNYATPASVASTPVATIHNYDFTGAVHAAIPNDFVSTATGGYCWLDGGGHIDIESQGGVATANNLSMVFNFPVTRGRSYRMAVSPWFIANNAVAQGYMLIGMTKKLVAEPAYPTPANMAAGMTFVKAFGGSFGVGAAYKPHDREGLGYGGADGYMVWDDATQNWIAPTSILQTSLPTNIMRTLSGLTGYPIMEIETTLTQYRITLRDQYGNLCAGQAPGTKLQTPWINFNDTVGCEDSTPGQNYITMYGLVDGFDGNHQFGGTIDKFTEM